MARQRHGTVNKIAPTLSIDDLRIIVLMFVYRTSTISLCSACIAIIVVPHLELVVAAGQAYLRGIFFKFSNRTRIHNYIDI